MSHRAPIFRSVGKYPSRCRRIILPTPCVLRSWNSRCAPTARRTRHETTRSGTSSERPTSPSSRTSTIPPPSCSCLSRGATGGGDRPLRAPSRSGTCCAACTSCWTWATGTFSAFPCPFPSKSSRPPRSFSNWRSYRPTSSASPCLRRADCRQVRTRPTSAPRHRTGGQAFAKRNG